MKTVVVEVMHVLVQQRRNIFGVGKAIVQIQFILHPTVEGFNNWIICWSSYSRHGTKYVIMAVGLAKSLGRVDCSLVGVEDYLGLLLFFFACKAIQNCKAIVIRLVVAGNVCDAVGKDLVIEGVQ